jgi:glyoxylase-like metal-dependent hydrolase (beta-lactamase superfamily II)
MKIGDLSLHLLCDGIVHVDAGGPFGLVPRVLYEGHFLPDADNRVPQSLNCLLVQSEGKTILIDAGLGPKLTEKQESNWRLDRTHGDLVSALDGHGLSPADIDIVIDTHLHWDHCGGNTELGPTGMVARFPNAVYLVQRLEWVDASHPDARTRGTYFADNFAPLLKGGELRLMQGDERITKHIRCVVTPGHTRGHQSVVLESGDWRGLFVADLASYAVNMARTAWLPSYDVLPLENIRTKQRWQDWAMAEDAWLFFPHDPFTPVGSLKTGDRHYRVEPIDDAAELTASIPTPPQPAG